MFKGKTPLLIAGALGVLAALIAWKTIDRKEKKIREGWTLVPVVVANRDVVEGTSLQWEMVAQYQMPEQFVTPSVVKPPQLEKVIGQKLMVPLQRGDLILWSHFRSEGTFERLSNTVRKKMRAVTMDFNGSAGVGGFVRPNDHVDILGTFSDPKENQLVTVTLMQNIIVLACGQVTGNTNVAILDKSEKNYANITVLMLPEEAEIAVLASQMGNLYLTLRNPEDISDLEERGRATLTTLLTGERVRALQERRNQLVKVIRLNTGKPGAE